MALATSDVIGLPDLPAELTRDHAAVLQPSVARAESMRAWGSRYARLMLEKCGHNKRRTCEVLGISYHTLQSYLRHPVCATGERQRDRPPRDVEDGDAGPVKGREEPRRDDGTS